MSSDVGPAFSFVETDPVYGTRVHVGMSLRDYFAAKAMAAMLTLESVYVHEAKESVASMAYQQADAMLARRWISASGNLGTTNAD